MSKRLTILGLVSLLPYAYTLILKDLRRETVRFEWSFFFAFMLYALAVWLVLRWKGPVKASQILLIFVFAIAFRAILIFSQPKLSDDMYRYVWDGRVQADQVNPYRYPPDAPELAHLRDNKIWPLINRNSVVTVYPAGAELAFAAIWRLWPDNVHWFQAIMAASDLIAGALLLVLLRKLGYTALAVLIYLWSPLVIFETAHAAHLDGLVLPLLVAAWLARIKERDALTGLFIGAGAALKLYPVLLLPILWRVHDSEGKFRPAFTTPLAFLAGFFIPYSPYLSAGSRVIGYLPNYLKEHFNPGLAHFIGLLAKKAGGAPEQVLLLLLLVALAAIYLITLLNRNADGKSAIRRCIWPIGAFTLLTQNLFPWYLLWLVPLLAIVLAARAPLYQVDPVRLPLDSWTGWWLFSGLIVLSYTFFIHWQPIPLAAWVQFLPLYALLLIDLYRWSKRRNDIRFRFTRNIRLIRTARLR